MYANANRGWLPPLRYEVKKRPTAAEIAKGYKVATLAEGVHTVLACTTPTSSAAPLTPATPPTQPLFEPSAPATTSRARRTGEPTKGKLDMKPSKHVANDVFKPWDSDDAANVEAKIAAGELGPTKWHATFLNMVQGDGHVDDRPQPRRGRVRGEVSSVTPTNFTEPRTHMRGLSSGHSRERRDDDQPVPDAFVRVCESLASAFTRSYPSPPVRLSHQPSLPIEDVVAGHAEEVVRPAAAVEVIVAAVADEDVATIVPRRRRDRSLPEPPQTCSVCTLSPSPGVLISRPIQSEYIRLAGTPSLATPSSEMLRFSVRSE